MPARIPLRVYSGYILIFYFCLSLSLLPFLDSTVIVLFLFNYNTVGTKNNIYIPRHAGFTFWYNRNLNIATNHGIENNFVEYQGTQG